jgi:hypothetical protein
VEGVWVLLAAAADSRIEKIWLDRTPHSLTASLNGPIHTRLWDAVIPGFLLRWDLADLGSGTSTRIIGSPGAFRKNLRTLYQGISRRHTRQ